MRTLYQPTIADAVRTRLAQMTADNPRQWGKMTAPQMMVHCSTALEMAMGRVNPPPAPLVARLFGKVIKPIAFKDSEPMRKNSPTAKELVVTSAPGFNAAREQLRARLDTFVAAGCDGCTKSPHPFFGKLSGEEWGALMFKHLDHHLRQFGA